METDQTDYTSRFFWLITALSVALMIIPIGIFLVVLRCASRLTSRSKSTKP